MVDHPKFVAHSDWRETFRLSEVDDDTCKLVVLTDDHLEILRRALKSARKRGNWIDSEDADGYMTPDDGDWDDTLALLDDLEYKLMSACDYVTLDDANERVGIGTDTPRADLDIAGTLRLSQAGATRYRADVLVSSGSLAFWVYDDTGSVYLPVRIYSSHIKLNDFYAPSTGGIGIGKEPSYALDVSGAAQISGAFGCNGQPPQTKYTVPGNATDLATVIALANDLRKALTNSGIAG